MRQLGPSGRLLHKNSCAVAKASDRKLTDFSRPWIDARTAASSSMTNTVNVSSGVIPRLHSSGQREVKLAPRGELPAVHKQPPCDSTMDRMLESPMPIPWLGAALPDRADLARANADK